MKINRVWLWIIPLTLLWPVLHLFVFYVRFGDMPDNVIGFLIFLPMSLSTGIIFLTLWGQVSNLPQKTGLFLGYLLSSPIAFIGSLLSGLVYPPIIGTLLWGAGPLVVGMLIGILIGYILFKIRTNRV
jgi:hypothetical protein